jgi:hypothetical protein
MSRDQGLPKFEEFPIIKECTGCQTNRVRVPQGQLRYAEDVGRTGLVTIMSASPDWRIDAIVDCRKDLNSKCVPNNAIEGGGNGVFRCIDGTVFRVK